MCVHQVGKFAYTCNYETLSDDSLLAAITGSQVLSCINTFQFFSYLKMDMDISSDEDNLNRSSPTLQSFGECC